MGNAQSHDEDKNESTGDSHALYSSNKIHFTNLGYVFVDISLK